MTNGDGSELALVFGERELPWAPSAYADLGKRRQQESLGALASLGLPAERVHFLGFPNNGLLALWRPEHWRHADPFRSPYTGVSFSPYERGFTPQAPYCGQQVLSDLLALLHATRPTAVFVTAPMDIHPDHWTTYCFVRYALATAALRGAGWARDVRVYGYLVHWPVYPTPRGSSRCLDLLPPSELVSGHAWLRLPLSTDDSAAKIRAVRMYRSQEPSFDRLLLAFSRANELFCEMPTVEARRGQTLRLAERVTHRRGLGGGEVRALDLAIGRSQAVEAKLETAPRPIPRKALLCLDLRTWDLHGSPVLQTVYVRRGYQAEMTYLRPGVAPQQSSLSVTLPAAGQLVLSPFALPRYSYGAQRLFVTCWGSLKDRTADPTAADEVVFAEGDQRPGAPGPGAPPRPGTTPGAPPASPAG
jgi:LmbE family N-acetylglucosaminyl deacetylase